jgi:Activator of Hsp90 ATPase homolog 1-like protein
VNSPLRITFDVACPAEHAFAVWTTQIGSWWPSDHTVTREPDLLVVLEAGVGGRIFERTIDGAEHDWGTVTVWEPPSRLGYQWHLGRDAGEATDVDIRFVARGPHETRVEIEHRGWERLGQIADAWRDRNRTGWETVLPHFAAAITRGEQ